MKHSGPCIRCSKRHKCNTICDKLAKYLPKENEGKSSREISVDPSRIEKYGNNIGVEGINVDKITQKWLDGRI